MPLPRLLPPRVARALALLVALLALVGLPALPAAAHAVLLSSSPSAGERVDAVPTEVVLEFNEAVEAEFGQLQVSGPDGQRLDQEPPTAEGTTVTAPLAAATAAGEHTVAFRIISSDGHPVEGQFTYEVSEAALAERADDQSGAEDGDETEVAQSDGAQAEPTDAAPTAPAATPDTEVPGSVATEPAVADEQEGGVGLLPVVVVGVLLLLGLGVLLARRGDDEGEPGAPA
jgi:copper resistance protein C